MHCSDFALATKCGERARMEIQSQTHGQTYERSSGPHIKVAVKLLCSLPNENGKSNANFTVCAI